MTRFSIALWACNIGRRLPDMAAWLAMVEGRMAAARAAGADLLVMPEYACAQWLWWRPDDLDPRAEIGFMAAAAEAALPALETAAARHGIGLLAGTVPVAGAGRPTNQAQLFLPDGGGIRHIRQDKLCLTPAECDPQGWELAPGDALHIVDWRGLRLAVAICLDVEQPAFAARLLEERIDLLLVPSMTGRASGYHRVFDCAKARAIELQTLVAVVGTIGTVADQTSHSGAAVFAPCEAALDDDGVLARLPPRAAVAPGEDPDGPMLLAHDLPIDLIREMRAGTAEVWRGGWRGDRLRVLRDGAG